MNRNICLCILIFLILGLSSCTTVDNKSSFDWAGTYDGILPGANSDIRHEVILNKDYTYKVTNRYIDRSEGIFEFFGNFALKDNNIIELDNKNIPHLYKYENNSLILLDSNGKRITGNIAHMYILKKR